MFKDYYEILEIEQTSSPAEIKNAFKNSALKWHPDKNKNIDTTEKMQDINEAYLILKDSEARIRYDIEYFKYKKFSDYRSFYQTESNENYENEKTENQEYQFEDDILKKWMGNARKQAVNLAKKTIKELAELSVNATTAAGSKIFEMSIFYGIATLFIMILFKACA